MRPMFFEWPVVAARPANTSEVGVHARPIGKGISSGTICAPRVPSSRVHRTIISRTIFGRAPRSARRRFVVFFPPRCRPDVRTTKDVVSVPLSVCACVGRQHVFCFCCCCCCCSLRARSIGARDVSDSPSPRKHQTWPSYGYTLVECVPN